MKKTIKSVILGASVLGILGAVSPAALANTAGDKITGPGCYFNTNEQATATNGENTGVIGDLSATTDPSGAPTGATVTCYIKVNGTEAPGTRFSYSGTGVQAGSNPITFTAGLTDTVLECQDVTYADGTTEPENCPAATQQQIPPQQVVDLINTVFDTVNGVLAQVDLNPVLCPALQTIAPQNIGGVIVIGTDGSLTITDPLGLLTVTNDCSVA